MNEWLLLVVVTLPLAAVWIGCLIEIVRRRDLLRWPRIAWFAALVVVPLVALAVYVVLRPSRPVESLRRGSSIEWAEAVVALAERRARGDLSDADYLSELRASTAR